MCVEFTNKLISSVTSNTFPTNGNMRKTQQIHWLILLSVVYFGYVNPEAFSSTHSLQNFIDQEEMVLSSLDDYVRREEERIIRLKTGINKIRQNPNLFVQSDKQDLDFASHPINAYHIIKRWHDVTINVKNTSEANINSLLSQLSEAEVSFPEAHDLEGAMSGVIRLQDMYNLKVEDIASGEVKGHRSKFQLGGDDFFRLGESALGSNDGGIAAQWLRKAIQNHTDSYRYHLSDAFTLMSSAYTMIGRPHDANRTSIMAKVLDGHKCSSAKPLRNVSALCAHMNKDGVYIPNRVLDLFGKCKTDELKSYCALCRGEGLNKDPKVTSSLVCKYRSGALPYVRYKEEIHNFEPRIVFFHDILSDREAEMLKHLAKPKLTRAMVTNFRSAKVSDTRIGQLAWLYDSRGNQSAEIMRLSQRVGFITGLNIVEQNESYINAEPFQVLNYGIGGHFNSHLDYFQIPENQTHFPNNLKPLGQRVATCLIYLSDPVAGGATVFAKLGVRVPAIKNGAVFWYNIHRSGKGDPRTEHAGCPVLLGQKWIANKWVREFGQVFRRQCGLTMDYTDL